MSHCGEAQSELRGDGEGHAAKLTAQADAEPQPLDPHGAH